MNIEIFPGLSGDCLLITSTDGKKLLADGGLPQAFSDFIAKPLSQRGPIDVAYVSHIDQDHIGGILRLLDNMVAWRAFEFSNNNGGKLKQPKFPRPPDVKALWHNAFLEDIAKTRKVDLGPALSEAAHALSGLNAAGLGNAAQRETAESVRMLAASVGEAIEVNWRISKQQLDIPLNDPFKGKLMTARPKKPIDLGSLSIKVMAPGKEELAELRDEWIEWVESHGKRIATLREQHRKDVERLGPGASATAIAEAARDFALAVEKDVTPPNLASLVLLVEEAGKTLFLTGDAGDETLLKALKSANLLSDGGVFEVDVLKVPHHGAHNSFSKAFVEQVRAQHYIFCGDGEHHNPEPDVVKAYLDEVRARPLSGGRTTTFWFSWSGERANEFKPLWDEVEGMFAPGKVPPKTKRVSLGKADESLHFVV